jgi:hypothetical protein
VEPAATTVETAMTAEPATTVGTAATDAAETGGTIEQKRSRVPPGDRSHHKYVALNV